MIEYLGSSLAIIASLISIIGTLYNNVGLNHHTAMICWMISNPLLLTWAVGYGLSWWDGGLSAGALVAMYGVYTITNGVGIYLLVKKC